jgi:putative ABC transport system substrate-binding protein
LELGGKWLELVKEVIPTVKRVAVFYNAIAEQNFPLWKSLDVAARSSAVEIRWLHAGDGSAGWLNENLRRPNWRQVDAFIVLPGFSHSRNLRDLADFGLRYRIPGILWSTELDWDHHGGLMAYGANPKEQARRTAYLVDKILKGTKPAELSVERPMQFELVINLKTAKEIGVTINPELLMWADRVIK